MCLCIKILPQTQNKFSFPQSQNKLNTIILRKKEKIIKKGKRKKRKRAGSNEIFMVQIGLNNLHEHPHFHFLIFSLNDSKGLLFFISSWTIG